MKLFAQGFTRHSFVEGVVFVVLCEALKREITAFLEGRRMEEERRLVIDGVEDALLEQVLEKLIECVTKDAEALGKGGFDDAVVLGFLDKQGGALFGRGMEQGVKAFGWFGATAFSARRERVEDQPPRNGGTMFGESLKAS